MNDLQGAAIETPISKNLTDVQAFLDRTFPEPKLDRVLLVYPPDADRTLFDPVNARRGMYSNFPPYGLAIIARIMETLNIETHILNLNHIVLKQSRNYKDGEDFDFDQIWQSHLDAEIAEFKPDLIGTTCMFTMTHNSLKAVCQHSARSGIPVMIGGVHVTNDVDHVLEEIPEVKIAILREGDLVIQDLVKAIRRQIGVESLAQIIFYDQGEKYRLEGERQPEENELNILPAFQKIEVGELSQFGVVGSYQAFLPEDTGVATSIRNRGCRARCTFCSVRSFNGKGVRHRSVESVLEELKILKNEFGIRHIMWLDDDLFHDHRQAIELFNGMVQQGLDLTWDASNGVLAVSCTEDVIAAAADSGCLGLIIGMESGNDEILASVLKPANTEVNLQAAEVLNKFDSIHSSAFLIIGFPGETMSMMRDTMDVSLEMNLDWYRIKALQPLPNTPIYQTMVDEGLINKTSQKEVRYMTGAYGKAHEIEKRKEDTQSTSENIFSKIPPQQVPNKEQIDEAWFFLNYRLNFARVLEEQRPIKLQKHSQFLDYLTTVIAPGNLIALYTKCAVEQRLYNKTDPALLTRLKTQLQESTFWQEKFQTFGLAVDDLLVRTP